MTEEYGDRYPSDIGDTKPDSGLASFSEVDYNVRNPNTEPVPGTNLPALVDDKPKQKEDIKRTTYPAVMLTAGPLARTYYVLRSDGRYGLARLSNALIGMHLEAGDDCIVSEGDVDEDWMLVPQPKANELPWVRIRTINPQVIDAKANIRFTQQDTESPVSGDFGSTFLEVIDRGLGVIEVNPPETAYYRAEFQVILECLDTEVGQSSLYMEQKCWDDSGDEPFVAVPERKFAKLNVNNHVGLELWYDTEDCSGNLTIDSSVRWSVLNKQDSTQGEPKWTNTPEIGGSLLIGQEDGGGFLKIGKEGSGSSVWMRPGNGEVKVAFFDSPAAYNNHFLVQTGQTPDGAGCKLGWLPPGQTGLLSYLDILYYQVIPTYYGNFTLPVVERRWATFRDGLLVDSQDTIQVETNSTVLIPDVDNKQEHSC